MEGHPTFGHFCFKGLPEGENTTTCLNMPHTDVAHAAPPISPLMGYAEPERGNFIDGTGAVVEGYDDYTFGGEAGFPMFVTFLREISTSAPVLKYTLAYDPSPRRGAYFTPTPKVPTMGAD